MKACRGAEVGMNGHLHALAALCLGEKLPVTIEWGARGGVVVKALRYKPAGRGFDSRLCHWNFSVT